MGQSLNCFAKTSSLKLAGDFSEFPDEFKELTYHQTEDPLSYRSEGHDGYKATFYSNKEEDKHILVHDRFIGFELGNGTIRRCLAKHVMGKTMKVEGDKLVVVDAQPVKDTNTGIKF